MKGKGESDLRFLAEASREACRIVEVFDGGRRGNIIFRPGLDTSRCFMPKAFCLAGYTRRGPNALEEGLHRRLLILDAQCQVPFLLRAESTCLPS